MKTKDLVILGIFSSIIILLSITPIGYFSFGVINVTLIHVPVIVGSILLGYKKGAILGFIFGLTSLINNTFKPVLLSFVFSPFIPVPGHDYGSALALLICFVPRILVGIVPFFLIKLLKGIFKNKNKQLLTFCLTGIFASLVNTLLVMSGIFLIFKDAYSAAKNISVNAVFASILTIIFMNGIPEAIVAAIITSAICKVLYNNPQINQYRDK
ncbi:Uncharacterized membrane protein [Anaerocolumna jejuensis DSM 15929]|uniref:Uncharacterized membrane protein n=1 Tax=Anaerocolumna jejuensis DSM 15929 TaxID=1121322 RepID=A0A1M6VMS1_9FIRM|nr:ECF transporter S component [Anaerocolumna jejuensis]SHK82621.1 Uncharacterized membrane protein [Anaerocolumna jejuensis DSM 15929]